ncbi:MAG: hypothetical protein KKD17_05375 [Nanoarchaeota archaeon]|nr:hypothetical protein [Nanoarchaeota archaeon]
MSRKHLTVFGILGIMIMLLAILGCQGYQAPKYKSPGDETPEEVEIDVSDLGEEEQTDEALDEEEAFWDEEEASDYDAPKYATKTPIVKPAAEIKSYKPAATEEEATPAAESDFKKSPYRPVIEEDLPTLTVTEGELVKLTLKATDPDGDKLSYEFTAPLNSEGKWQTRSGDAGVYYPEITVSDGKTEVVKKIKILVEPKNNKPVLQFIPNIDVNEGDTVTLNPKASDADGDKLTYTYSGWMSSNTKTAGYNDAGVHKVTVSVSDGISIVSQEVTVTVKDVNRPPEVEIEF